jgi:hypothetical protein
MKQLYNQNNPRGSPSYSQLPTSEFKTPHMMLGASSSDTNLMANI